MVLSSMCGEGSDLNTHGILIKQKRFYVYYFNLHLHSFLSIKYLYSFFSIKSLFNGHWGARTNLETKKRKTDKIIVADNVQAMHVQDS